MGQKRTIKFGLLKFKVFALILNHYVSIVAFTMRDPRFNKLFEQVPIGPVIARNRFFRCPNAAAWGIAILRRTPR